MLIKDYQLLTLSTLRHVNTSHKTHSLLIALTQQYNQTLQELDYTYLDVSPRGNSYNIWVHKNYLDEVINSSYPDEIDDWRELNIPKEGIMPGIDVNIKDYKIAND